MSTTPSESATASAEVGTDAGDDDDARSHGDDARSGDTPAEQVKETVLDLHEAVIFAVSCGDVAGEHPVVEEADDQERNKPVVRRCRERGDDKNDQKQHNQKTRQAVSAVRAVTSLHKSDNAFSHNKKSYAGAPENTMKGI